MRQPFNYAEQEHQKANKPTEIILVCKCISLGWGKKAKHLKVPAALLEDSLLVASTHTR